MKSIATISETTRILETYQLQAKKSLGQNFIIDPSIINKIVDEATITKETAVIEIGPGIGALSQMIAHACKKLVCFEIDSQLKEVLTDNFKELSNIEIIFQDFLSVDLVAITNELLEECREVIIVSNLPYYVTTKMIEKVLISKANINRMIIMVQKEVADKLTNPLSNKEISPLYLLMKLTADVNYSFTISKTVFIPKPNVESAVIKYVQHIEKSQINKELLYRFLNNAFNQRRKTLYNNLKNAYKDKNIKDILEKVKIQPNKRAEELSFEQWMLLYPYFDL